MNEYPTCVEGVMLVDGLTILVGVIPFVVHVFFLSVAFSLLFLLFLNVDYVVEDHFQ